MVGGRLLLRHNVKALSFNCIDDMPKYLEISSIVLYLVQMVISCIIPLQEVLQCEII